MTKLYAVGFTLENGKVRYAMPKSRIRFSWRRSDELDYITCSDIDEAKHYEKKSRAMSVIRNLCKNIAKHISNLESELKDKSSDNSWRLDSMKRQLKSLKKFIKEHSNMSVFEYEVDDLSDSNLHKVVTKRLKWRTNYDGSAFHPQQSEIITETHSRHSCKCCGVILKNIPQVRLGGIYGGVVCVRCIMSIGEDAKRAWDAMPDKAELEKEFFVHNLG